MAEVEELLKKHDVKPTIIRKSILSEFKNSNFALSHSDLEKSLGDSYDRVTIYRAINMFEKNGLIHKIIDDGGISKYALCFGDCMTDRHNDDHVHFKCNACNNIFCLDEIVPNLNLPEGYSVSSYSVNVEGKCKSCG